MKFFKTIILIAAAIGIGIFLGAVPIFDGMTAADLLEDWLTSSSRDGVQKSQRIALKADAVRNKQDGAGVKKTAQDRRQEAKSDAEARHHSEVQDAAPEPARAPITAEAANSPEQTSASDKAALDALINKKSGR